MSNAPSSNPLIRSYCSAATRTYVGFVWGSKARAGSGPVNSCRCSGVSSNMDASFVRILPCDATAGKPSFLSAPARHAPGWSTGPPREADSAGIQVRERMELGFLGIPALVRHHQVVARLGQWNLEDHIVLVRRAPGEFMADR